MYGLACTGVKYELGVPLCSVIRAYVRTTPHILVEWENKWAIPYQITTQICNNPAYVTLRILSSDVYTVEQ